MHNEHVIVVDSLADAVDALYQKFGLWRTAGAIIVAALRQRRKANSLRGLSSYMLRDIGMLEDEDFRRPQRPSLWDLWL